MKKGNIKLTNKSKTAGIEDCYFTCTSNNNKYENSYFDLNN